MSYFPFPHEVEALAAAMGQLLSDFGKDGETCCRAAVAQARIAYEPWIDAEDTSLMMLAEARKIMSEADS